MAADHHRGADLEAVAAVVAAVILEEEEETVKVCGRCICCFWNRTRWRRKCGPRARSTRSATSQFLFEDGKSVDVKRTLTFTFLGAFLVGPALHFWYGILGKIVTVGGSLGAGVRLGLDQLAFAPVFLATFLSALFAIEGNTDKLPNKLKQDLFPTVVANWKIWVPFQFLNFRFVPANLQVGAANVIALAWNVYLSWASHKKVPEVVIEGKNTKKKGGKR